MGRIVDRVRALALAWGAPGLFIVALLDSSVLPLPGITDILLIVMVTRRKAYVVVYIAATTLGSLVGCLAMHALGRKGGEAFVRQRFGGDRVERALASLRRYGVMAVLIPALLPPPAPFKIFVLLAGVVGISAARFGTAIAIGRGIRYIALGWLAYRYGDDASQYLAEHGTRASLLLVAAIGAGFTAYVLWRKARNGKSR